GAQYDRGEESGAQKVGLRRDRRAQAFGKNMNRAVIIEEGKSARETSRFRWSMIVQMLTQPQPVTIPMVVLMLLIPFYFVIGKILTPGRILHAPALALDGLVPLQPAWSLIYCSFY